MTLPPTSTDSATTAPTKNDIGRRNLAIIVAVLLIAIAAALFLTRNVRNRTNFRDNY